MSHVLCVKRNAVRATCCQYSRDGSAFLRCGDAAAHLRTAQEQAEKRP